MSDKIPENHPRYASLITREHLVESAHQGIVSYEGLTSHGRGEAFDYLLGEKTSKSARFAEMLAAICLMAAVHPVISVNGNTAALAAAEIAELQQASGAQVEVNLFHRTEERVKLVEKVLEDAGCVLNKGKVERCVNLPHDRGLCDPNGIGSADVVLVPLEDGDRCEALVAMGKTVITIDLNPIDRTSRMATLPIIDEVRRALPNIAEDCRKMKGREENIFMPAFNSRTILRGAIEDMVNYLEHALD
ncbi:MAG TPA: 4-phosphopantoate--beta-alanine ligase [Methanocorpusculum sp.]|nr:4-phosphopantoate--beta-alanine ligase [Methanocorpusculum sp.]